MIKSVGLTKYYGNFPALKNVSFEVKQGEVVGLLGLNGAGKSTCLKILAGYLIPTQGEIYINGIDIFARPLDVKKRIGYLPETPPLYMELTVRNYLRFVARLRGVPENRFNEELDRVLEYTQTKDVVDMLIGRLSLGYRKRTGIAQALIGAPPVLIFDEPISGLDPLQIVEIRKLIRSLAGSHTIFISSHILTEVSRTCDRVLILHNGSLKGELIEDDLNNKLEERFIQITQSGELTNAGE